MTGTVTGLTQTLNGVTQFTVTDFRIEAARLSLGLPAGPDDPSVFERLRVGNDMIRGGVGKDILGGYDGRDMLDGGAGHDVLAGMDGNDSVVGAAGDDTLVGGLGNDTLIGGTGIDWAFFSGAPIRVTLERTRDQNTGEGVDRLSGIENLSGGDASDRLTGNAAANELNGGAGNDTLTGLGGKDTLVGEIGADSLLGGTGDDALDGGLGSDVLDGGSGADAAYFFSDRAITVTLEHSRAQTTGEGSDRLLNIEDVFTGNGNDRLTGNGGDNYLSAWGGNDRVSGLAGKDTLEGGAGRDTLLGGSGNDTLAGGAGDDLLDGGAGLDTAWFETNTAVRVSLATTSAQTTREGTDRLIGIEDLVGGYGNDQLTGNSSGNTLIGRSGNDTLLGGAGTDMLVGGAGHDKLYGGADTALDIFSFRDLADSAVGSACDVIYDFRRGIDYIALHEIYADHPEAAEPGGLSYHFAGTRAAAFSVWYERVSTGVIVHADVNGDARTDMDIRVAGVTLLTADDFLY